MNLTGEFDAYVSCSMENKDRVMEILERLENRENRLRVCLPERDLLAGLAIPMVTPELITKRYSLKYHYFSNSFHCKSTIII